MVCKGGVLVAGLFSSSSGGLGGRETGLGIFEGVVRVSLVAGAGLRASGCLGTGEGSVIDDSTVVVLAEIGAAIMGGRSEEVVSAFNDKVTLQGSH